LARELIILPRFKRDYRTARKHPEFEAETLEYVFDTLISGGKLPEALREHRLSKRSANWAGLTECHLGADLCSSTGCVSIVSPFIESGHTSSCSSRRPLVYVESQGAAINEELRPSGFGQRVSFATPDMHPSRIFGHLNLSIAG
jgi:addiction module RelE/StbE family toxin